MRRVFHRPPWNRNAVTGKQDFARFDPNSWKLQRAAEPVPADGAATAGRLGGDTAEFDEGGLVADPFGVVAGGHQELAGQLDPDAEERDQLGRCTGDEQFDLAVECFDLRVQGLPAAGQIS